VTYTGDDPEGEVLALNFGREMTPSQRAVVAARFWVDDGDTHDKGKGRRKSGDDGKNCHHLDRDALAKHFGTNRDYMRHARDLLEEAPEIADAA
jgi:hypothetical protein